MQVNKSVVESLIECLNDKNVNVRQNAAEALGSIGDARSVAPLVQALKDENEGVRYVAVMALVKIGKPSVKALVQASKDKDSEVRERAVGVLLKIGEIDELVKFGKPVVELLIQALKEPFVQESAAKALGIIGDERAVEPLIQALKNNSYYRVCVRQNAAWALGKIGDARAVIPLAQALEDDSYDSVGVRQNAAKALVSIGDARAVAPLVQALNDKNEDVRYYAITALAEIGTPTIEPLIQVLKDRNASAREEAVWALVMIGKPAVEPLIQVLKDRNAPAREKAMWALGEIGDLRAAEEIINHIFTTSYSSFFLSKFENLLGDYANLIFKASVGFHQEARVNNNGNSGSYSYDLGEINEAIIKLGKISTQISNNILHKISKKKDVKVIVGYGCRDEYYAQLSFESQRKMAEDELKRRGNPLYDPSVYLDKKAWKL